MRDSIVFPLFSVFVWTGENVSNRLRVDAYFFLKKRKKSPFSNENGYVWTGAKSYSKLSRANRVTIQLTVRAWSHEPGKQCAWTVFHPLSCFSLGSFASHRVACSGLSDSIMGTYFKTSKAKIRRAWLGKGGGGLFPAPARFSHFFLMNDISPPSWSLEQASRRAARQAWILEKFPPGITDSQPSWLG